MAGNKNSGRRPKPPHLKVLEGGRDRRTPEQKALEAKPKVAMRIPQPPAHMPDEAKDYWRRKARELHPIGLLTNADLTAFEQLAMAWHDWRKAVDKKQMGYWVADDSKPAQRDSSGKMAPARMVNPYIKIEREEQKKLSRMEIEFGMTPSSRAKVQVKLPQLNPDNGGTSNDPADNDWGGLVSLPRIR